MVRISPMEASGQISEVSNLTPSRSTNFQPGLRVPVSGVKYWDEIVGEISDPAPPILYP